MVARLIRLRLALLGSAFRGRASEVFRRIVFGLLAIAAAVGFAWLPDLVTAAPGTVVDVKDRGAIDVVLSAVVVGGALLVPVFSNRRSLEPRQFGQLPVRPSAVATALLGSSGLSWPALWMVVWLVAVGLLRPELGDSRWALIVALVLVLLLAICGARVASGFSKLVVPRRSEGTLRAVGLLMLIAALPVVVFAVAQALRAPESTATADAARVLGWTPLGAPLAGAELAAEGDLTGALVRFAIALGTILVLIALWYPLVRASLERIERPSDASAAREGLGWFERFSARPASAIGARALSYWTRDPRYRIALIAIPLAPVVMVLALLVAGVAPEAIALVPVPVVLLLLGWSLHNDVAMDSTAIWLHVASGTRGRDDRLGRMLPVLLIGLPVVLVGSSVSVTIAGDWRALPAVLGMNLAVLLVACASASVFSAWMPYPATRPGDSPFAQPSVSGSGAGLAQTLSMLFALLFSIPAVWVSVSAIVEMSLGANIFALIFGIVYGCIVLAGGVLIGGRVFDRSSPELVALTQTFD